MVVMSLVFSVRHAFFRDAYNVSTESLFLLIQEVEVLETSLRRATIQEQIQRGYFIFYLRQNR